MRGLEGEEREVVRFLWFFCFLNIVCSKPVIFVCTGSIRMFNK